jgi:hypothetical protein
MFKILASKKTLAVALVALALVVASSVRINVRISPRDLAFGQAASYPPLAFSFGANVNGKPSLFPATSVIDTQTAVAAGTLNGTNSPVWEVTNPRDFARMVNISFNVTAVPGTSPSLTPTVQQSDDGGISYYTVNAQDGTTFAAITATGAVAGKDFPVYGDLLRIHYVSSGTGNFTFTDTAKQAQ